MASAPSSEPRQWLLMTLGIGLPILAMAGFDAIEKGIPANKSANAFVVALRENRVDDACSHATPELRTRLALLATETPPWSDGTELARAVSRLSTSRTHDGSFGGDWSEGCVDGTVDGTTPMWLIMRKPERAWLVDDLRIDAQPPACVFKSDGD